MSLFKRCDCSDACRCAFWFRFRLNGREYRGSTKTANKQLAQQIAGRKYNDAVEGKSIRRLPRVLLSAAIKTYNAHVEKEHRTADKAERVLSQFQDFIGDRPLAEISPFLIEKWKLDRAQKVEQSTVSRELNVIKGLFRRAVAWRYLIVSPAAAVQKYRTDDTRIRVLSADEIKIVLTKTPSDVALLCRATLECLARLSELLSLRREHIGPNWIEVRRKGGRVERIAVTTELRAALLKRAHQSGFVFGTERTGEPASQESVSSYITRVMRGLGLSGISHHTMRHTGVTLMLEAGVNPRVIQQMAGWSTLRMLERYGHVRDAEAHRAVTAMRVTIEAAVSLPDEKSADTETQSETERAQKRAQRQPA